MPQVTGSFFLCYELHPSLNQIITPLLIVGLLTTICDTLLHDGVLSSHFSCTASAFLYLHGIDSRNKKPFYYLSVYQSGSDNTVNGRIKAIKQFFKYLFEDKLADKEHYSSMKNTENREARMISIV